MTRTMIQLPDELYRASKGLSDRLEISLAELVRRGLEYMVSVSPAGRTDPWTLPAARGLGGTDPFADPNWRADLHTGRLNVAESAAAYRIRRKRS
jgi:hypothetical protein